MSEKKVDLKPVPRTVTVRGKRSLSSSRWKPAVATTKDTRYRSESIEQAMSAATCSDLGCDRGKVKGRTIGWPAKLHGLPVLHCSSCKQEWSPVDLGLMTDEEANETIESLRR